MKGDNLVRSSFSHSREVGGCASFSMDIDELHGSPHASSPKTGEVGIKMM